MGEPAFHDLIEPVLGDGAEVGGLRPGHDRGVLGDHHDARRAGRAGAQERRDLAHGPGGAGAGAGDARVLLATRPLVDLFNGMGNLVLKPFGIPPASEAAASPTARTSCASCCARARRVA